MADKQMTRAREDQQTGSMTRSGPLGLMSRFAEEMDRLFDDFGFGRGWPATTRARRSWLAPARGSRTEWEAWAPDVDVFHRGNELVVRADLPGLKREDINVEVTEDAITIQGERKHEQEEERDGVYRAERSYGSFYRAIPLPEGTMADQAKANFRDGVLEVTVPAPPEGARRGRRLEIGESAPGKR